MPPSPVSSIADNSLGLTAGIDFLATAPVYARVPGSPTDAHAQWVIVPNSDNSIRYSSSLPYYLFLLTLFPSLLDL